MSYPHSDLNIKERGERTRRFWFTTLIVVLILVALIVISPLRSWVSEAVLGAADLVWKGRQVATGVAVEEAVRPTRNIISENRSLKEELNKTESLRLENKSLREENRELRSLLSSLPEGESGKLATILSRPASAPFDTFIISGGEVASHKVGDIVYGTDFVALGKVAEVYSNKSKVVLFSSNKVETNVLVGPEYIALVAVGRGGQNFSIELPEGLAVNTGDALVLPTEQRAIIGSVGDVKPNPDGTTKTAVARSPINMYQLRFVLVVSSDQ